MLDGQQIVSAGIVGVGYGVYFKVIVQQSGAKVAWEIVETFG